MDHKIPTDRAADMADLKQRMAARHQAAGHGANWDAHRETGILTAEHAKASGLITKTCDSLTHAGANNRDTQMAVKLDCPKLDF